MTRLLTLTIACSFVGAVGLISTPAQAEMSLVWGQCAEEGGLNTCIDSSYEEEASEANCNPVSVDGEMQSCEYDWVIENLCNGSEESCPS